MPVGNYTFEVPRCYNERMGDGNCIKIGSQIYLPLAARSRDL